nr:MAG TPA: hypothetical protein [Caudoviricetes sp.]
MLWKIINIYSNMILKLKSLGETSSSHIIYIKRLIKESSKCVRFFLFILKRMI